MSDLEDNSSSSAASRKTSTSASSNTPPPINPNIRLNRSLTTSPHIQGFDNQYHRWVSNMPLGGDMMTSS